jgi:hypothetical protein
MSWWNVNHSSEVVCSFEDVKRRGLFEKAVLAKTMVSKSASPKKHRRVFLFATPHLVL